MRKVLPAVIPAEAGPRVTYYCDGLAATHPGTNGNDVNEGSIGNDVIVGRGGHDTSNGNGGVDVICGGSGNDIIDVTATCSWAWRETICWGAGPERRTGPGAVPVSTRASPRSRRPASRSASVPAADHYGAFTLVAIASGT